MVPIVFPSILVIKNVFCVLIQIVFSSFEANPPFGFVPKKIDFVVVSLHPLFPVTI